MGVLRDETQRPLIRTPPDAGLVRFCTSLALFQAALRSFKTLALVSRSGGLRRRLPGAGDG